ncbi:hypothetical protein BD779DRAFT_1678136 [Infundibulicybe gibba]|nr:hypothetical protein BD779DRAFT_1678136 [Infundibulicybe gibba]
MVPAQPLRLPSYFTLLPLPVPVPDARELPMQSSTNLPTRNPAGPTSANTPPNSTINASIHDRQRVYGVNTIPSPRASGLAHFLWITVKDKPLISPLLSAALILDLGMCGSATLRSSSVWKSQATVIIGSLNNWYRGPMRNHVNNAHVVHQVTVIRGGAETTIDAQVCLIPFFLSGHDICDEPNTSGKLDAIVKMGLKNASAPLD